jgi:hypothetical protein
MDNLEHGWQQPQASPRARVDDLAEAIATALAAHDRARRAEQRGDIELARAAAHVLEISNTEVATMLAEMGLEASP